MRYRSPHAAGGGGTPLTLRGPKPMQMVLTASVAGAIGLVPALFIASPAQAVPAPAPPPSVSMDNQTAVEGQPLTFTLNYTGSGAATYQIGLLGGTGAGQATGGGVDYQELSSANSTVTFTAAGSKTITVQTVDDNLYETAETFSITATNAATGMSADTVTATGTINDNDIAPSYKLSAQANVDENVRGGLIPVTATLSAVSGVATTVQLNPVAGSGTAPSINFGPTITNIVIPAGQLSASSNVSIIDDGMHDVKPMSFTVNGVADNVISSGRNQGVQIGINDVEAMPKLQITKPASGSTEATGAGNPAVWVVTTDVPSSEPITVDWSALPTTPISGHDAATPGDDFTYPATGRTVTIPAGRSNTSVNLPIYITADNLNELPEDYTIGLSNPTNAVLGTTTKAVDTITDANTTPPAVTIDTSPVPEGDSGTRQQTFTATLTPASGRTVTVNWATANDTATAGYDYVQGSGTVVFKPGETTKTFTVGIIGDKIYENPSEDFKINLTLGTVDAMSPVSATITHASNTIVITDDDAIPTIASPDMSVKEGDTAQAVLVPFTLSNPTNATVTVGINSVTPDATHPASSTYSASTPGSGDYSLLTNSITIQAGQTTGYAVVLVNGDMIYEPDESFTLNWHASNVVGVSGYDGTTKFTILNDDKAPTLDINDVTGNPGDTVAVTGNVTGMSQDPTVLTVTFAGQGANGKTGAGPSDFVNPGGTTVTIGAGTPIGTVTSVANVQLNQTDYTTDRTIVASGVGNGGVGSVVDGVITIKGTPAPAGAPTISGPTAVNGASMMTVTGKAAANANVDIWGAAWSPAMPALTKLTTVKANASGMYTYTSAKMSNGYRFKAAVGDLTSNEIKVAINQWPVLQASSPSLGKISISAWGNPAAANHAITIQKWVNGAWATAWSGKTASNMKWMLNGSLTTKSKWTFRAWYPGDADWGINGGYSSAVAVTIK